jgi:hypothetical protein
MRRASLRRASPFCSMDQSPVDLLQETDAFLGAVTRQELADDLAVSTSSAANNVVVPLRLWSCVIV